MKLLRVIGSIVLSLAGMLLAVVFLTKAINPSLSLEELIKRLLLFDSPHPRIVMTAWAIVMTFSSWVVLATLARSQQYGDYLVLPTEEGDTRIAVRALEDFLNRSISKMDRITDMRAFVRLRGKQQYTVHLKGSVLEGTSIPQIDSSMKSEVISLLKDKLGLPAPLKVNADITKLKSDTDRDDDITDVAERQLPPSAL